MTVDTCRRCGQVFNLNNSPSDKLCTKCYHQNREEFRAVKDYLWHHPGATVQEIANNIEVSEQTIRKFVRQGRFDLN